MKVLEERSLVEAIILKCRESGLEPQAFLKEKLLELEERKRILLMPTRSWFNANKSRYNELAAKLLHRELSDQEKYDPHEGLAALIARRFNPERRQTNFDLSTKRRLLTESKGRCALCGILLLPGTMHVDHKLSVPEGGSSHTLNLQALCETCNLGKSDYFEETAEAAARPWYEPRQRLVNGKVKLTPVKRFCVLIRDKSTCQICGVVASGASLKVVPRISVREGGQLVYDNLRTCCTNCASNK